MNQIKVRAGQVWEFVSGADNYEIGDRLRVMDLGRHGLFHDAKPINIVSPSHIYSVSPSFLNKCFAFIPQNDLEWLAVNVKRWVGTNHYVFRDKSDPSGFYFLNNKQMINDYSHPQWQNMRYYLGLDKKPHYELINKEWVKQ